MSDFDVVFPETPTKLPPESPPWVSRSNPSESQPPKFRQNKDMDEKLQSDSKRVKLMPENNPSAEDLKTVNLGQSTSKLSKAIERISKLPPPEVIVIDSPDKSADRSLFLFPGDELGGDSPAPRPLRRLKKASIPQSVDAEPQEADIIDLTPIKCPPLSRLKKIDPSKADLSVYRRIIPDSPKPESSTSEPNNEGEEEEEEEEEGDASESESEFGVSWMKALHDESLNGILADEMGLGKTVQTIALLSVLQKQNPLYLHLIVVPASTLENWSRELGEVCSRLKSVVYYGSQRQRLAEMLQGGSVSTRYDVVVTTFNVLGNKRNRKFLKRLPIHYLVVDEAQNLKNSNSTRYLSLSSINCRHRLLLTGTPLQNNLGELWALLTFLMPQFFPRASSDMLKEFKQATQSQELITRIKTLLAPFMLRRLKVDVLSSMLPKKRVKIVTCHMVSAQEELYRSTVSRVRSSVNFSNVAKAKGKELTKIQNLLMELRKIANHPCLTRCFFSGKRLEEMAQVLHSRDIDYCRTPIREILEDLALNSDFELQSTVLQANFMASFKLDMKVFYQSSGKFLELQRLLAKKIPGHRVLLFSQMTRVLDMLEPFLLSLGYAFLRLDGSTPVESRQGLIDDFRESSIPIFLLSTRAGGLGINLTAADVAIFYDISYNPQVDLQAEDRCHRMGQTKTVKIYKLITKNTVEESILEMAAQKQQLRDAVLEEGSFAKEEVVSVEIAKALLSSTLNPNGS